MSTTKLWQGIRRHGLGWQAEVRITGHPRAVEQFPLDTPPAEMQHWRKEEKARLRRTVQRVASGTFADDANRYLKMVAEMPSITARTRDIGLWVELFGTRRRSTISRGEIRAQRDAWRARGPKRVYRKRPDRYGGDWIELETPLAASTVNHRLRALANLWTELDGRHAPNPVREVPELDEGDGGAYGLPYAVIEAILDAMPDRGQGLKKKTRSKISLTKIRARVIAYTGLSNAEIGRLTPEQVNFAEGWVSTGTRRKGKGALTGRRPLTAQGLAALQALADAKAWGPFARSSMRHSIRRACERIAHQAEQAPDGAQLAAALRRFRPYDFRHSYVSEILDKSGGDFHATRLLAGHADLRTTMRYLTRTIDPVLSDALAKVLAAGGFAGAKLAHSE
ncbi:MAG TPA: site-specific integrase [Gemmatimonadaceae bacterium]|nr:site-specific integrase [Gemmatimonadaceae bacterium]